MNDTKLRLDYLRSNKISAAVGDNYIDGGINGKISNPRQARIINELNGNECSDIFITSFTPRKNTGVQPCGDDVPVVGYWGHRDDKFKRLCGQPAWSLELNNYVKSWKPDIDELIKMQIEHDKQVKPCASELFEEKKMPRTKTEYVKVTDSIFDLQVDFERGELWFFKPVDFFNPVKRYMTIKCIIQLAELIETKNVYRKVETEITWQDEAKDLLLSQAYCEGDDLFNLFDNPEDTISFCRFVVDAVDNK
jgi:hypothetical protein